MDFKKEITRYVWAGQTVFTVNSREEARVIKDIRLAGWLMAKKTSPFPDTIDYRRLEQLLNPYGAGAAVQNGCLVDAAVLVDTFAAIERRETEAASSAEADRLQDDAKFLATALDAIGYRTVCWNAVTGWEYDNGPPTVDLAAAIGYAAAELSVCDEFPSNCFVVMKDCNAHLNSQNEPAYRRALRNVCETNELTRKELSRHLFFLQPHFLPHEQIRHCFVKLDYPLPGEVEIDAEITALQGGIVNRAHRNCPEGLRDELIQSLRGLDTANISKALSYCAVRFGGFVPEITEKDGKVVKMAATVRAMRSRQLSSSQGIRIIDPDDPELTSLGRSLGGYENVRELAERLNFCRTKKARELGIRPPSGFATAGPPGGGKTASARLFATWVGLPLVTVNLSGLKEGIVGASEANTEAALATIRALGECAVLFDEWDKQSGGIVGSFSDGNTSSGMLSMILDFASDPRRQAFLIFTMNRLHGPIESLRSGRISRFFYTPLPDALDREEILTIKLAEQEAVIPKDLSRVAKDTDGFSGAELTELVNEAITMAAIRCGKKEPHLGDFKLAQQLITPVTKLGAEEMAAMTNFKNLGAVSVSKEKKKARGVADLLSTTRRVSQFEPGNN